MRSFLFLVLLGFRPCREHTVKYQRLAGADLAGLRTGKRPNGMN